MPCSLVQCYISENHNLNFHFCEKLKANVLKHQKGNRELHICQQSVQVHKSVTKLLLLRITVCWDVTMQCWGITLLCKPHHSHYAFMFEPAVLVCCREARDIHNVIIWNNGANLSDCTLLVYPHLYLPLHHHIPLQPLTTSTMLCHWFMYCASSFKLLIPRICRCSVTPNLTYWLKVFVSSFYILAL
jgi:hypothetical protein